ncbi:MAG: PilT/PilU family type 4a pilus ATPase [Gemmatimonadota bacterium]|nr:PilT/PilU family type 4a pilus ATPase [Gemmatimonadota bacterium]
MENIIKAAIERGASDLHIKAGDVFRARIDGKLVALTTQALTPEQTRAIALRLIPHDSDRSRIDGILDYDCSWGMQGVGRFRVNISRQRSSVMVVMRVIPMQIPTIKDLGLPKSLDSIARAERGIVLVTGASGSGKTSTIAAMINALNQNSAKHIVTLENPIEYLHRDRSSSITQREIGSDTESFKQGLRAALRQDPDVIMLGELRDAETVDTAMKAAETGHLLISTLHTPDAQTTILRVVAMFAPEEQPSARLRLAEALHAVVSQRLLPRADGKGRVVVAEVMVVTPLMRDLIADESRTTQLQERISADREAAGMQTFDQHLTELVKGGTVSFEVALAAASRPSDFDLQLRTLSRSGQAPRVPGPLPAPLRPSGGQRSITATPATSQAAVWHEGAPGQPAVVAPMADAAPAKPREVDPAVRPVEPATSETHVAKPSHTPEGLPAIEGYTPNPVQRIFGG